MSNLDLEAEIVAAKAYEDIFVPAVFAQWATKVLDAANVSTGQRVLDIGCGTGVVAREALVRTGPTGFVAGLDPGAGMLTVARELCPLVDWRQGVAESLPFPDASFDAVVSQFGLMFMDRERAIPEMLRVLRSDGCIVVATWDLIEQIPAYAAAIELIERMAGERAAAAVRAPFVLGSRQRLTEAFENAGAGSVTVSTSTGVARFPRIRTMVEADLRGWLPVMGVNLTEDLIIRILESAEDKLACYVADDGRFIFDMPAHIVTARKS